MINIKPVDFETFLYLSEVFEAAASMKMPVQNPASFDFEFDGDRYAFTDNPVNRGMIAVRQSGVSRDEYMSFSFRLFTLFDLVGNQEDETDLIKDGDLVSVSEALMYAISQVRFKNGEVDKKHLQELIDQKWQEVGNA